MTSAKSSPIPVDAIAGVLLAGGRAQRMGGQDKGLIEVAGRPMAEHILSVLRPQVGGIIINANRNLERYAAFGYPVVADSVGEFFGPLAGMASAMRATHKDYIITVPCDSPLIPPDLVARMAQALMREDAEIAVAHDGDRVQPVFALLHRGLLPSLLDYLQAGDRKIDLWFARHKVAAADFSDCPDTFLNVNTPDERAALENRMLQGGAEGSLCPPKDA